MATRFRGGNWSWRGDPRLKADILAQMTRHHDAPLPRFVPLEVEGVAIAIYGWDGTSPRLDLAADALGLPEDLLVLGWYLFEGFPDCHEAVAEEIASKRDLLALIPVGLDTTHVTPAFIATCLGDRPQGIAARAAACDRTLIDDVAIAVELELEGELARLAEPVATRAAALRAEILALGRAGETHVPHLHHQLRDIEAAASACRALVDPRAALGVAARALSPSICDAPNNIDAEFDRLVAILTTQLAALG